MVLDFASRIIGPLGAACIAWLGVSQTLDNSQRLDRVKEWHTMLRWATDMCNASSEREVEAGIAILDSIDRQSEIPADQHEVIDAILTAVFRNPNTPFEEQR